MKKFLNSDGQPPWGLLSEPAGTLNYMDYPLRSAFRELLPQEQRQHQFVHFHFMGFTSERFIAGCSMTLIGSTKTAFFYLFDRTTKELVKFSFRLTNAATGVVTLNPDAGRTLLTKGDMSVQFESDLSARSKSLNFKAGDELELDLHFSEKSAQFETLRLCTPTGPNGWTYCQKVAGIPATGHLKYKGQSFSLEDLDATAHHDFTAGFLRRDTFWNWACISGIQKTGEFIGLNVSNGVNETGGSENRIWRDGRIEPLDLFSFSYNLENLEEDWLITSENGSTLTFRSEGKYAAFNNKLSTGFDFHQLFGCFNGKIVTQNGEIVLIRDLPGFCERQFAIWYDEHV